MHGIEWIVEAQGCRAEALRDAAALKELFTSIIEDLDLHPVGETRWHSFPGSAGVTGLCLLSESHLAIHTFPEHQSLCLNLFCCRPRREWAFEVELRTRFGAEHVNVRSIVRPYGSDADALTLAANASEAER